MQLEARKYLRDIQVAAGRIARFAQGKSFQQYLADEMLRSAVERQFGIIGEALSRLSRDHAEVAAEVPDRAQIIAFRNILIHGYDLVDHALVWSTVQTQLPALLREVMTLLASCP